MRCSHCQQQMTLTYPPKLIESLKAKGYEFEGEGRYQAPSQRVPKPPIESKKQSLRKPKNSQPKTKPKQASRGSSTASSNPNETRKTTKHTASSKSEDSSKKPLKISRKSKKEPFFRKWTKRLVAAGILLGITGMAGTYGMIEYYSKDLPSIEQLKNYKPPTVTVIYDRHGEILGELYKNRRYVVPLDQIPEHVQNAFIAAEDANFWQHQGVDYMGIVRAVLRNAAQGKKAQGASTITQQVARNFEFLLSKEKTYERKIREILLAQRMEQVFDKQHILYLYLNQIYFGSGAHGIEAASRVYFNKSVQDITIAEAAILAGLPQRPSAYSPHRNWKSARGRQEYVLGQMLNKGYIDATTHKEAIDEKVAVYKEENKFLKQAPFYTEHVRRYLLDTYGEHKVYEDGLEVITACDLEAQKLAQTAIHEKVSRADRLTGWRGPKSTIEEDAIQAKLKEQELSLCEAESQLVTYVFDTNSGEGGHPPPPDKSTLKVDNIYEAVVLSVEKKHIVAGVGSHQILIPRSWTEWAYEPNPDWSYRRRKQNDLTNVVSIGDVVDVRIVTLDSEEAKPLKGYTKAGPGPFLAGRLWQDVQLEGALLSYRVTQTTEEKDDRGAVLAMVGGFSFEESEFNRAIQALRQVGSTFKPIVYAAAIESKEFTVATMVQDAPTIYQTLNEELWKPGNYGEDYLGNITLRRALQMSRNVCTIRVLDRLSLDRIYDLAGPKLRIGYDTPTCERKHISVDDECQGSTSVSPVEGMQWCEYCIPESCPLVQVTEDNSFECMDTPQTIGDTNYCRSCDVNLRVCDWLPITKLPENDRCLDPRLDSNTNEIMCRSCDLSMGLGSSSLTMLELARAYSVFATYGKLIEPYFIESVKDRDGTVIETHEASEPEEVLDPSVGAIAHWLVREVATGGTGAATNRLKIQVAGKTGTTNDFFDAWFVGYSPEIITATWVGYDQPKSMGVSFTGGNIALPMWMDYMGALLPPEKKVPFKPLPGIQWIEVDETTGLQMTGGRRVPMLVGTAPKESVGEAGQMTVEDMLRRGF